jgi:ubiquinone/menaquinone biosynthesis C-methylase UbiE
VNSSGRVGASVSDCELEPLSSSPFLASVRDGYERWAPTYDHFPNPLLAREQRHIHPLLPRLRNRHVLDLACGTGRWLKHLLAVGALPGVGVDLSSAMLRVAGDKRELSGKVVQADCLRLPFRASTFDFSICSFALGHIQDLRSVAVEFSRLMKPGSDLFVTDLHPEAYAVGWRTGFRDQQSVVQVHTLSHSSEDILGAFSSVGCECVTHLSLWLGDAEQPLFAAAGRQQLFQAACRVPAILFCHFKRALEATATRGIS